MMATKVINGVELRQLSGGWVPVPAKNTSPAAAIGSRPAVQVTAAAGCILVEGLVTSATAVKETVRLHPSPATQLRIQRRITYRMHLHGITRALGKPEGRQQLHSLALLCACIACGVQPPCSCCERPLRLHSHSWQAADHSCRAGVRGGHRHPYAAQLAQLHAVYDLRGHHLEVGEQLCLQRLVEVNSSCSSSCIRMKA
jgi:hypothetical protein